MVREDAVAAEVLWDLRAVALQAAALMAAALMATKRAEVSRAVAHAGAAVEEARWASGRRRSSPRHGKGTASGSVCCRGFALQNAKKVPRFLVSAATAGDLS